MLAFQQSLIVSASIFVAFVADSSGGGTPVIPFERDTLNNSPLIPLTPDPAHNRPSCDLGRDIITPEFLARLCSDDSLDLLSETNNGRQFICRTAPLYTSESSPQFRNPFRRFSKSNSSSFSISRVDLYQFDCDADESHEMGARRVDLLSISSTLQQEGPKSKKRRHTRRKRLQRSSSAPLSREDAVTRSRQRYCCRLNSNGSANSVSLDFEFSMLSSDPNTPTTGHVQLTMLDADDSGSAVEISEAFKGKTLKIAASPNGRGIDLPQFPPLQHVPSKRSKARKLILPGSTQTGSSSIDKAKLEPAPKVNDTKSHRSSHHSHPHADTPKNDKKAHSIHTKKTLIAESKEKVPFVENHQPKIGKESSTQSPAVFPQKLYIIASVIIGIIVIFLIVLTSVLWVKHVKKSNINLEKLNLETQSRRLNMISRSQSRRRPYNLMEIDIERTLSSEAPCRSWMICDKIGKGRFGEVRLAINPNVHSSNDEYKNNENKEFDIKNISMTPKFYAVKRARFDVNCKSVESLSIFHEIIILSKLNHSNIVRYYGNGVANGNICLFLEWCPLGSMADVLYVRKSFGILLIHQYIVNLLSAIDYLHVNQMYHRDIKAKNILLCKGGICKLADFGSAVDATDNEQLSVKSAGTIHWWPPETFLHSHERMEVLAAHDIWSLGVTVIEMVNGVPPYHQLDIDVFKILMKSAPDKYCVEVPVTDNLYLNDFIASCLNINCAERLSVQQLLKCKFIVKAPKRSSSKSATNALDSHSLTSSFLQKKELEAQRYANSIISGNMQFWLADKMNAKNMNKQRNMTVIQMPPSVTASELIHCREGVMTRTL